MGDPLIPRPPTNGWDVLKVAVIACFCCFMVNAGMASNLRDLSEVKGAAGGAVTTFGALGPMRWLGRL